VAPETAKLTVMGALPCWKALAAAAFTTPCWSIWPEPVLPAAAVMLEMPSPAKEEAKTSPLTRVLAVPPGLIVAWDWPESP